MSECDDGGGSDDGGGGGGDGGGACISPHTHTRTLSHSLTHSLSLCDSYDSFKAIFTRKFDESDSGLTLVTRSVPHSLKC